LPAMAVVRSTNCHGYTAIAAEVSTQLCRPPVAADGNHDAKRVALDLALDLLLILGGPVKPRWPNAGLNSWLTRRPAGLAAPRHGWRVAAAHGFKSAFGHTEPKRGAEWWGKSALLTLPLLQSEPPSGRNPK